MALKLDGTSGIDKSTALIFDVDSTEYARIDSSGNVLVGKTSGDITSAGVELRSDGLTQITRSGNKPLLLNRKTSDGDIAVFQKDATTVGSISNRGSTVLQIHSSSGAGIDFGGSQFNPLSGSSLADASIDIGQPSFRFSDLYLSGGVYVGGTGSANYLDDYEEGTFTPSIIGSSGGTATPNSNQEGHYTKIGRVVTLNMRIQISSKNGISGNVQISNLPFVIASNMSSTDIEAIGNVGAFSSVSISTDNIYLMALDSTDTLGFRHGNNTTSTSDLTNSEINDTFDCRASITYFTS